MNTVHGFVTIESLVSNTPGRISQIGELSTNALTYSKEKGEYTNQDFPDLRLTTFSAVSDTTGQMIEVPASQVYEILAITRAAIAYTEENQRPYLGSDFQDSVEAEFAQTVTGLQFGELVNADNIQFPEYIEWKSLMHGNASIKIWFSNRSFEDQYPNYDVTIIPPLENLNQFFFEYGLVESTLNNLSYADFADRIQEAKQKHPETIFKFVEFEIVNRYDRTQRKKTTWGVLIYGKNGDDIDVIKDKILDWVLENSNYDQTQWEMMFPDIFLRTELTFIPQWNKIATTNLTDNSSLYSSVMKYKETLGLAKAVASFYPPEHIEENTAFIPHFFRTLGVAVINGTSNSVTRRDFAEIYPDYIPVPTTSTDFARMSVNTQKMAMALTDLLMEAETMTATSWLPEKIRRVQRQGKLFASTTFDGINLLVALKINPEFNA